MPKKVRVSSEPEFKTGLLLALAISAVVIIFVVGVQAYQNRPYEGVSAYQSREQLQGVLMNTFTLLGVEARSREEGYGPVSCGEPTGPRLESYSLNRLEGRAAANFEDHINEVVKMWEANGLAIEYDTHEDSVRTIMASNADRGSVYISLSPTSTRGGGSSACRPPE